MEHCIKRNTFYMQTPNRVMCDAFSDLIRRATSMDTAAPTRQQECTQSANRSKYLFSRKDNYSQLFPCYTERVREITVTSIGSVQYPNVYV